MVSLSDIEETLKMKMDDWQREFIEDDGPRLLLCCGRKCGKTTASALKICLDLINLNFSETDGICIISKGQRQAREIFLTVRGVLQSLGYRFGRDIEKCGGSMGYSSMTMLKLPNGNKCYALPCGFDGVTLRTYSFYKLYRDEDAFIPEAVDAAVGACLAVHGVQEIRASTPAGTSGSFYKSFFSGDYHIWKRKTRDCVRVPKSFLIREKRRMSKVEYAQEYEAEFVDVAEGIFEGGMIASCTSDSVDWAGLKSQSILFLGVDFARFGDDENVIAYNYYRDGVSHIRIEVLRSKFRTTHIAGRIKFIADRHQSFKRVITDEGGVGGGPTDLLIETLGKRRVLGVANQKRFKRINKKGEEVGYGQFLKVHLYRNLQKLMETGKVVFDDDLAIARSLRSMKYKYTMRGELTIYGANSHAAEAIVRAVFPLLIKKPLEGKPFFSEVPHKDSFIDEDEHNISGRTVIR